MSVPDDVTDEGTYDRVRMGQWLAGQARGGGLRRRDVLRALGVAGLLAAVPTSLTIAAAQPAAAAGSIVKPLPPELFDVLGTNAEMRWEAMRGQGFYTPIDRFFVRNHTSTAVIDPRTWRLRLFGAGLRGAPTRENAVEFSLDQLRSLPAVSLPALVECAGNGRSFFATQQNTPAPGNQWKLGAVGVARWRGVRLATVLRLAGLTRSAVDVMPQGLDAEVVSNGVNLGHVRRPLPVAKALQDVLLAYEMNGEPLPPDHGAPVRLIVPSWVGVANIKWVGDVEVSDTPLFSPFNTQLYRLFGPEYPADGAPITTHNTKSAFELPWQGATLAAGRTHLLRGRSWSGNGGIRRVRVSTDGGATWRRAHPRGPRRDNAAWLRWELPWRPEPGNYELLAAATDETGATQPARVPFNTNGYLYGAVVRHAVTVV
ncbi:sulfite oxidase [Streptoalloteichus hindustanus]|uniref:DMSO/TMAO reductase YedYZ, molybdopterin-dependent catalytic subunit n=1 Tax=Streptoalloteichus hindustanus TaxID=2017 RepID=A0A1M5FLU1_STRHI|nr:sulfite oxidase [Streptoalloteichus hindustanus]SHF92466.1 DMSO/TMAO reductase YedYZ, molybdopterin-dependent catalytic subunit [Streptoalloteichus hindustanus]